MNIFLPYPNDLKKSVQSLDNRRLCKQILECKQILQNDGTGGYSNHPIVKHYREFSKFVSYYGALCCEEYSYRFNKDHSLTDCFKKRFITPKFIPLYVEGHYIRETDPTLVSNLFKDKLLMKWKYDKYAPNWGIRGTPEFYELWKVGSIYAD